MGVLGPFGMSIPLAAAVAGAAEPLCQVYDTSEGAGQGKHIVLLSGDEEYRSEEALPMLGKILSVRHGFRCTVLFAVDGDGNIDPNNQESLTNPEALDSADAIVMLLRFRRYPDATMARIKAAIGRGIPIIGLRTSTHAFAFPDGRHEDFNRFGKRVLGEQWVNHWGHHKYEATRTVAEPGTAGNPILRGVGSVFCTSDVYEAYPPADAAILLRGQVLTGMTPDSGPAAHIKKRTTDGGEQPVNDPMMPVAWTRLVPNDGGTTNRVFCTTMGAATDLLDEALRRLVVNAVFWGLEMDVPAQADVTLVDPYEPTMYGFGGHRKGLCPADFGLGVPYPPPGK